MPNWININIPWRTLREVCPSWTKYQEVMEEAAEKTRKAEKLAFPGGTHPFEKELLRQVGAFSDLQAWAALEARFPLLRERPFTSVWLTEVERTIQDEKALLLARHRRSHIIYSEWWNHQPANFALNELRSRVGAEQKARSFAEHPACHPGTLVQVKHITTGGEEQTAEYLLGDCDTLGRSGGQSSEDEVIKDKDIILAYAEILEGTSEGKKSCLT